MSSLPVVTENALIVGLEATVTAGPVAIFVMLLNMFLEVILFLEDLFAY